VKIILSLGGNPSRLDTSIPLLQSNPGSHLIISSEGPYDVVASKLQQYGVSPDRYTIDETAWDTVTNFTNTLPLVKKLGGTEVLVVTDGFHMKRSMRIAFFVYLKTGIKATAHPSSPVDHNEDPGLVRLDTFRAALYRLTGQTLYTQKVYDDRIIFYYNEYYTARNAGAPVSPK
jgi:uncharacterized SAM-binding protein YcdF (DUF218 family)